MEEQIESDDRAERLEVELQHTQDRAAELEFQVSKLKQVIYSFCTSSLLFANNFSGTERSEERTRRIREADSEGERDRG